nr:MAG TPA: hypothetical protein [Caudoviricetes sp.]
MPDSTADLPSRLADSLTATTVWQQELIAKLLERGNAEAESGLDVALIIHDLHAQVETLTAAKVVAEQRAADLHAALHDACDQRDAYKAAHESRECCQDPWLVTVPVTEPAAADGNAGAASGGGCVDTDAAAEPDSEMQSALGLPTELVDSIRQAALASLTAIDQCREAFENGDDGKAFKCMKHAAAHMRRVIDGLKTVNNIVNGGEE